MSVLPGCEGSWQRLHEMTALPNGPMTKSHSPFRHRVREYRNMDVSPPVPQGLHARKHPQTCLLCPGRHSQQDPMEGVGDTGGSEHLPGPARRSSAGTAPDAGAGSPLPSHLNRLVGSATGSDRQHSRERCSLPRQCSGLAAAGTRADVERILLQEKLRPW